MDSTVVPLYAEIFYMKILGQILETETTQRHSQTKELMKQMDLTDIYKTFYPNTKGYTFFSAPHGTFSKINHIIGHQTRLNR
jgi:exonuclease III